MFLFSSNQNENKAMVTENKSTKNEIKKANQKSS